MPSRAENPPRRVPLASVLKAGPYIGPRGGKWADPQHTRPWVQADWVGPAPKEAAQQRAEKARSAVREWKGASAAWKRARTSGDREQRRKAYQRMYDSLHALGKALNLDPSKHGGEYARAAVAWLKAHGHAASLSDGSPPKAEEGRQMSMFKGWRVLDDATGARLWALQESEVAKGRPVKYVRRVPTGNPRRPWRYYYSEAATVHAAKEGARINLRGKGTHDVVKVHADGRVKLRHTETGEERTIHATDVHAAMHEAHGAAVERGAKRAVDALLRAALPIGQTDGKGLWASFEAKLKTAGIEPHEAKALIAFLGSRQGWSGDAKAVLAQMAVDPKWAKVVRGRERIVASGAERLAAAEKAGEVGAVHVVTAASIPTGIALDETRAKVIELTGKLAGILGAIGAVGHEAPSARAMAEYAKTLATNPAAAELANAVKAFPALADAPEWKKLEELRAKVHALAGKKQDGGKGIAGAETTIFVADESGAPTPQKARYRLVEAEEAIASHDPTKGFAKNAAYPEGVQERHYHSDKEHQGVVRQNAAKLRPELVVNTNPDAANGPPIMDSKGIVLGGNSRTMAIQMAHAAGGASHGAYVESLKTNAGAFGFTRADVEGMKAPLLVREVETGDADPKVLVRRYNEVFTQGMDPRVDQVARARLVTSGMVDVLAQAMSEQSSTGDRYPTLSSYLGAGASKDFVSSMERAGIIDRRNRATYLRKDGTLNEDGKVFVERLLVGRIIPSPDVLGEMSPSQVSAVAKSVPHIIRAASHGHDIAPALKEALEASTYMDRHGIKTPDEMDRSQTLGEFAEREGGESGGFGGKPSLTEEGRAMLELIRTKSGPVQMAGAFRDIAQQASRNPVGQGDLLGRSMTTADILRQPLKPAQGALFASQRRTVTMGKTSLHKALGGTSAVPQAYVELDEGFGALLYAAQEADIAKGAGHKYLKRVPYTDSRGRRRYRYFYNVAAGYGLLHDAHIVEGAKFKVGDGHYHVDKVNDDGSVSITHDETGESKRMTREKFSAMLAEHHGRALDAHRAKLRAKLTEAKPGSPQYAALHGQATRAGLRPGKTAGKRAEAILASEVPASERSHLRAMTPDEHRKVAESKEREATNREGVLRRSPAMQAEVDAETAKHASLHRRLADAKEGAAPRGRLSTGGTEPMGHYDKVDASLVIAEQFGIAESEAMSIVNAAHDVHLDYRESKTRILPADEKFVQFTTFASRAIGLKAAMERDKVPFHGFGDEFVTDYALTGKLPEDVTAEVEPIEPGGEHRHSAAARKMEREIAEGLARTKERFAREDAEAEEAERKKKADLNARNKEAVEKRTAKRRQELTEIAEAYHASVARGAPDMATYTAEGAAKGMEVWRVRIIYKEQAKERKALGVPDAPGAPANAEVKSGQQRKGRRTVTLAKALGLAKGGDPKLTPDEAEASLTATIEQRCRWQMEDRMKPSVANFATGIPTDYSDDADDKMDRAIDDITRTVLQDMAANANVLQVVRKWGVNNVEAKVTEIMDRVCAENCEGE